MFSTNYRSSRLELTPLIIKDKNYYCSLMSNAICLKYIGHILTTEQAEERFLLLLNYNMQRPLTRLYLRVSLLATGEFIGIAAINQLNTEARSADIGRMLLPSWHGKGLGTELSQLLIDMLLKECGISFITKHIRDDNLAAIRSARRLGFVIGNDAGQSLKEGFVKYNLMVDAPFSLR